MYKIEKPLLFKPLNSEQKHDGFIVSKLESIKIQEDFEKLSFNRFDYFCKFDENK